MKTKVSCQPEQAIEPSAGESGVSSLDPESSVDSDVTVDTIDQHILDGLPEMTKSRSRSAPKITSDSANKSLYVPVKSLASGKTSISKKIETTNSQISDVLCQIKTVLEGEKNSTKEILDFFERENERARQHELDLFRIMFQPNRVQQAPRTTQQPRAAAIHDQHPQVATVQHPPAVGVQQIPTTTAHQISTTAVQHAQASIHEQILKPTFSHQNPYNVQYAQNNLSTMNNHYNRYMVNPSFHPGRFILSHLDTGRQDSTIHDSLMNDKNSSEDQHYQAYSREKTYTDLS